MWTEPFARHARPPPDGKCIECVSTKPWDRAFWKRRKQEVMAGVQACTWCEQAFDRDHPATIHHTRESYKTTTGKIDWFAYMMMQEGEVEVICKGCHLAWSQYGKKRSPQAQCLECGTPTRAPSRLCSKTCGHERRMRTDADYAKRFWLGRYFQESASFDYESCQCEPTCPKESYSFVLNGDWEACSSLPACQLRTLAGLLPGMLFHTESEYDGTPLRPVEEAPEHEAGPE